MIEMVNGDTLKRKYKLKDANKDPVDITNFEIIFSVKKKAKDTEYVFQCTEANTGIEKIIPTTNGEFYLTILPDVTLNLKIQDYVYDIQVRNIVDGNVKTVQLPTIFKITKGVTD